MRECELSHVNPAAAPYACSRRARDAEHHASHFKHSATRNGRHSYLQLEARWIRLLGIQNLKFPVGKFARHGQLVTRLARCHELDTARF